MEYPEIPVLDYNKDLTNQLLSVLDEDDHADHREFGLIHASSLGGCLLHDAWSASTLQKSDWGGGPMPAFLGNAFEQLVVDRVKRGAWPGVWYVAPPVENEDGQHHVSGLAYGLPGLKGHLDGIVQTGMVVQTQNLLELKLMSPWRYRDFLRGHIVQGKAKTFPGLAQEFPQYNIQIQVYMGLAGLTKCLFIAGTSYGKQVEAYVPSSVVVLEVPFSQDVFWKAIERAEQLQACLDKNVPPKCEHHRYCNET